MNIRWRTGTGRGALLAALAALLALAGPARALAAAAAAGEDAPTALDGLDDFGEDDDSPLHQEESRNVRPRAYPATAAAAAYGALPSGFRAAAGGGGGGGGASLAELAGYQPAPAHPPHTQQQHQQQRVAVRKQQQQSHREAQLQRLQAEQAQEAAEQEAEREEEERPDRLQELLQQSRFECAGKQSGYYADQELACEVFHYCQDSVKHSWICPDGFTFHQVHLICMPPTHDNICQKSAKYHFVNEYLYRPVNEEEVARKPNVSLRYSDRYYPAEVYRDDRYDDQDDDEEEEAPRRAPAAPAPARLQAHPAHPAHPAQPPHVFRSAEEVNIPLGQRRPQRPYDFDF